MSCVHSDIIRSSKYDFTKCYASLHPAKLVIQYCKVNKPWPCPFICIEIWKNQWRTHNFNIHGPEINLRKVSRPINAVVTDECIVYKIYLKIYVDFHKANICIRPVLPPVNLVKMPLRLSPCDVIWLFRTAGVSYMFHLCKSQVYLWTFGEHLEQIYIFFNIGQKENLRQTLLI